MKKDIYTYRDELVTKLETVRVIINELEGTVTLVQPTETAPKRGRPPGGGAAAPKGKRTMSPEARARISAAAKLRWKKAKASGKNTL